jgi:hypothetical protein
MSLTLPVSRGLAVVMLGGALIGSRHEMRLVPASTIPLEGMPSRFADWTRTTSAPVDTYGVEVKTIHSTYQGPGGRKANVILQATYTRLGALRDWSLARTTGGWNVIDAPPQVLRGRNGGAPLKVRLQSLSKADKWEVAVSCYLSHEQQASSLAKAEIAGWRDRLVGRRVPWFSLFVSVPGMGDQNQDDARKAALELAQHIAHELQSLTEKSEVL